MKQPYLYFGRKGYMARAAIASGDYSGTAMTIANSMMLPANIDVSTASTGLELTHRAVDAQASTKRSAIVIAAGPRPGTQAFSGSPDEIVAGEVSILDSASGYFIDGTNELNVSVVGTDGGLTPTSNDFIYLEEVKFTSEVLPFATTGADVCLPASSFISAQPVAYTAGGGIHWDGSAQDMTQLIFKPLKPQAGGGVITIKMIHTADKYKEVCEAMEVLCNSQVYEEAIKVHQLTVSGQVLHNAFSSRGIKVYGLSIS
tara:strand:- start:1533 stop:2306 length:774 start_codon:yes stop_codon:yes gene_type:complete